MASPASELSVEWFARVGMIVLRNLSCTGPAFGALSICKPFAMVRPNVSECK